MDYLGFLNMVSSAAPPRKGEQHLVGVVGFAIAVEDESGALVRQVVRRVRLMENRRDDLAWMTKYGVADPSIDGWVEPAHAAAEALAALDGVTQAAAHFVVFHREQLRLMIDDGGLRFDVLADIDWFDTMHKSTAICAISGKVGRAFKPSSLAEATHALTGEHLRPLDGLPWQEALLVNLSAVRAIYHRLHGRPTPEHLTVAQEAML